MKVSFTAPYPPTTNLIYRMMRGHMRLTEIGRNYKSIVASQAAYSSVALLPYFQADTLVGVSLNVYRPRKIGDIDNVVKLILDGMQDVVFPNDKQIIELHIYRHDDKDNPRVEVEVIRLATVEAKPTRKKVSAK